MNYNTKPVATLTNRKMELFIKEVPARLGRNNNVVEVYLFHESVSREHCLFECINGKFTVRDLNSTVGTYINGSRLEPNIPYIIEDGTKIQFGKVKMVFHADYQALAEWERMQAPAAPVAPQSSNENASAAPKENRSISVSVRELSEFDYDEADVVYIDCGLKPAEVESAEEEPVDWKQTQILEFSEEEKAALAEAFADEDTFEIKEQNEEKKEKTLHLTWIDDISGETKKLKIDRFPFAIGRKSDDNDYTIARKGISRKHMRFEESDGEIYLYDDASTNGVRLNGEKIMPETMVKLNSGDSIRVLDIIFAVSID